MQYLSSLTQKGQATIPQPIREKLGLKSGDLVTFEINDSGVVTIVATPGFFSFQGAVKKKNGQKHP